MRKNNRGQDGLTLLETMLAMVVIAIMIVSGIRLYQSMRVDSEVQRVLYNVDEIFQAAANYYMANCRRQNDPFDPTGTTQWGTTGTLDPTYAPGGVPQPPINPYPVQLTQLQLDRYLTTPLHMSTLVESSGANGGYVVQFNRTLPDPDRIYTETNGSSYVIGKIVVWHVQVAVNLRDAATAAKYKDLLGADCVSTLVGTQVEPCATATGGEYVVWQRLPSGVLRKVYSPSNSEEANATLKQFKQQYEEQPLSILKDPAAVHPQQYYLCGS